MRILVAIVVLVLGLSSAFGQALIQAGSWTPGHAPGYSGSRGAIPLVQDSGPAGGAGPGLSEGLYVQPPTGGTGPYGANWCDYDAPIASGAYHYFCIGPNGSGGGLLAYGSVGGLPEILSFYINGVKYNFPATLSGVLGPVSSVVGDISCFNNTQGSLLVDCGPYQTHAALVAAAATPVTPNSISQLGYTAPGDSGAATYTWNASSFCPGGTSLSPTPADGVTCILPSGQLTTTAGRYLLVLPAGILTSGVMGFVADGVTDNSALMDKVLAFEAAGGSASGNGYEFRFGPGSFYFSRSIELHIQMTIEGNTYGQSNEAAYPTTLLFANNIPGIVINGLFTCVTYGYSVSLCPNGTGAGSVIRNLYLQPTGGVAAQTALTPYAAGIWMRNRATIENVVIQFFAQDGIRIVCSSGTNPGLSGNCNGWIVRNAYVTENYGNGLHIGGSDANAGYDQAFNTFGNNLFGILDDSFLTDAHIAPQSAADGAGNVGGLLVNTTPTPGQVNYNGNRYRLIQSKNGAPETAVIKAAQINPPTGTTSDNTWWHYMGAYVANGYTPQWGQVVESNTVCTVIPGQESIMWSNDPLTSGSVWTCAGAPTVGVAYVPWTTASEMVLGTGPYVDYGGAALTDIPYGPYVPSGADRDTQSASVWINPYIEGTPYSIAHMPNGIFVGAQPPTSQFSFNGLPTRLTVTSAAGLNNGLATVLANNTVAVPALVFTPSAYQTTASSNSVAATCTVANTCHANAGRYTVGATPNTSFTVSFTGVSFPASAPSCEAFDETTAAANPMRPAIITQSLVTFTGASSLVASDKVSYICMGI